ncbi:hypothetical protein ACFVTY_33980 [Streptomyces sp. NPDC058067]|uniref:hypothetical protein n=1 Tax=Streptomyces sp. NPDC058067 TaxID=3346324 RepID=UPI0036F07188
MAERLPAGDTQAGELVSQKEKFLFAFRETLKVADCAHYRIADKAQVGRSSISCYNTGKRVPEKGPLERIYKVVEEQARRHGTAMPYSLAHLLRLEDATRIERVSPEAAAALPTEADSITPTLNGHRPASGGFRKRRYRKRAMLARRKVSPPPQPTEVPVPPREGDRHLTLTDSPHAAAVADYRRHLGAGRIRDAHFIAWVMGSNLPSHEFPQAVASYREAGSDDGAETMLNAAANRDRQASINITAALLDKGQLSDAHAILNVLRTDV